MQKIAWLFVVMGSLAATYGIYTLIKYIGLGGDNSKSPYFIVSGMLAIVFGIWLLRKK